MNGKKNYINVSSDGDLLVSPEHKVYAKIAGESEFSLKAVKEVYELVKEGKEVWFLDGEGEEGKIKSIEKVETNKFGQKPNEYQ